ncbi:MAG: hypothetical protein AB8B51_00760 [Sedimentitalea sp.]
MGIDETKVLEWISASNSMFDIAVGKREELPDSIKVIGPEEIDRDIKSAFDERLGAFPTHKAQRLLQRGGARVAQKIATHRVDQIGVSVSGLRHAWFHPVFSELTSLVPIRHLARLYAQRSPDQIIAVEVPSPSFIALNSWNANHAEPLYLAHELRRQHIPVFLLIREDPDQSKLSFELSDRWLRKGYPRYFRDQDHTSVLCKNAVRRSDLVATQTKAKRVEKPGLISRVMTPRFRRKLCRFDIKLVKGPVCEGLQTYTVPHGAITLEQAFMDLLGPLTQRVADWYRSEMAGKSVQTAHVADHASLEGGLLAAEVVRQGGQIHIWPHSANVVHMGAHDPKNVAKVTMAVRSTAAHWAKDFGPDKVGIDPQAILPETPPIPAFDEDQPLHVVLFAGAHFLRRVPLIQYGGHKTTWTKTLDTLQNADVKAVVKHKSVWETRDWIAKRASDPADLQFSNVHANKLRLPNMVFLSVSLTSTAILEGIARGIPGLVVRDVPADETPYYDPDYVPCLASDQLGGYLKGLSSKASWDRLRDRQGEWYRQETQSAL